MAHGQERKGEPRGEPPGVVHQTARDQEDEERRGGVDEEKAEMDAPGRLAEAGDHQGVGRVDPGELRVVEVFVGQQPAREQLAPVGVLAFVTLQGNGEQTPANEGTDEPPESEAGPRGSPTEERSRAAAPLQARTSRSASAEAGIAG